MASVLEEKLREASCVGDLETVETLLTQSINVNSQNPVNGWTPLHWACKRGNERVVRLLLTYGADKAVKNYKEETPSDICAYSNIHELLGSNQCKTESQGDQNNYRFVPNYIKNAPLNAQVDLGPIKLKQPDFHSMPKTSLPTAQNDEKVPSLYHSMPVDLDNIFSRIIIELNCRNLEREERKCKIMHQNRQVLYLK